MQDGDWRGQSEGRVKLEYWSDGPPLQYPKLSKAYLKFEKVRICVLPGAPTIFIFGEYFFLRIYMS